MRDIRLSVLGNLLGKVQEDYKNRKGEEGSLPTGCLKVDTAGASAKPKESTGSSPAVHVQCAASTVRYMDRLLAKAKVRQGSERYDQLFEPAAALKYSISRLSHRLDRCQEWKWPTWYGYYPGSMSTIVGHEKCLQEALNVWGHAFHHRFDEVRKAMTERGFPTEGHKAYMARQKAKSGFQDPEYTCRSSWKF